MINHLGRCPHCNTNWNAGDIKQTLGKLDAFSNKTSDRDVTNLARNYGWTETNGASFTLVTIIQIGREVYYQCPNITCGHLFNRDTEDEYRSRVDLDFGNKFERKHEMGLRLGNQVRTASEYPLTPDECYEVDEEPPFIPDEIDKPLQHENKNSEEGIDSSRRYSREDGLRGSFYYGKKRRRF